MADESTHCVVVVLDLGDLVLSPAASPREKGKKAGPPVFDDRVQRTFTADAPNKVWVTDITEHRTISEGKLYCCAIKDLCGNRIVGYSLSCRMTAQLAVDALNNAVARRRLEGHDVAGCIVHADRGSQFRSRKMGHALNRHGMVGSMGRVGAAGDNAARESFWSLLQTNVLNQSASGAPTRSSAWPSWSGSSGSTTVSAPRTHSVDPHRTREQDHR